MNSFYFRLFLFIALISIISAYSPYYEIMHPENIERAQVINQKRIPHIPWKNTYRVRFIEHHSPNTYMNSFYDRRPSNMIFNNWDK